MEDATDANGKAFNQQPAYDKLLNSEVVCEIGDEKFIGTVKRQATGPDGKVSGSYNDNPYLNSIIYEVQLPDGQIKEYSANLIAENILGQVDDEGYSKSRAG